MDFEVGDIVLYEGEPYCVFGIGIHGTMFLINDNRYVPVASKDDLVWICKGKILKGIYDELFEAKCRYDSWNRDNLLQIIDKLSGSYVALRGERWKVTRITKEESGQTQVRLDNEHGGYKYFEVKSLIKELIK